MTFSDQIVLKKFNFYGRDVCFSNPELITNRQFPDFMLVGPQRTGTTWLWTNLLYHPHICINYPKETCYFSNLEKSNEFSETDFLRYLDHFNLKSWLSILKKVHASLFFNKSMNIKHYGEASATYSVLNENTIRLIRDFNPNMKIIITIRNPVERALSNIRLDHYGSKPSAAVKEEDVIRFIDNDYQVKCGFYSKNIERWQRHLGEKNVLLINFDDIKNNPDVVLSKVFNFLGVDVKDYRKKVIFTLRAKSKKRRLPIAYKERLVEKFREEFYVLKNKYGIDYLDYLI